MFDLASLTLPSSMRACLQLTLLLWLTLAPLSSSRSREGTMEVSRKLVREEARDGTYQPVIIQTGDGARVEQADQQADQHDPLIVPAIVASQSQ